VTRPEAKRLNREVYTYLYFFNHDTASVGKISSKAVAGQIPGSVLLQREIDLKRIEVEFKGSHKEVLKSLDPATRRGLKAKNTKG